MNKKSFFIILLVVLVTTTPTISAQFSIGQQANQKLIEVNLDTTGIIYIKHVISSTNNPVNVNLFEGTISNLIITNEVGEEKDSAMVDDGYGNKSVMIFPSKQKSIIEYNLEDKISMNENLADITISYSEEFAIKFSDKFNLIYVNGNPISLDGKKGINVNGGGELNLQYHINVPEIIKNVQWEEDEFNVEIISDVEINDFNFEQTSKSISFKINEEDKIITVKIPEILLGGPYVTLLNDEKIKHSKWLDNEKNVSITIKPESTGQITIIGTTVIPEFSMFIPLIMGFLIVLTVPFMKKFNLH
jgi:hypothetical protein